MDGVAGKPEQNPYEKGTDDFDSYKHGYTSGVNAGGEVHSIFSDVRKKEFASLIGSKGEVPIILGWGRDPGLLPLAKQCLNRVKGWRSFGIPTNSEHTLFSHPSPMLQTKKDLWRQDIINNLNTGSCI